MIAEDEAGSCAPAETAANHTPARITIGRLNVRISSPSLSATGQGGEQTPRLYDNPLVKTMLVHKSEATDFSYTYLKLP
jgi:hypothetical protein